MTIRQWTFPEASGELAFIQNIDPRRPGAVFNNNVLFFVGYCSMQANQARRSGFSLIAMDIERARDLALRVAGEAVGSPTARSASSGACAMSMAISGKPERRAWFARMLQ